MAALTGLGLPSDNDHGGGVSGRTSRHDEEREADITAVPSHNGSISRRSARDASSEKGLEKDTGAYHGHNNEELLAKEEMGRREEEVHRLAKTFTNASHAATTTANPFLAGEDSSMNPSSDKFSARAWAKTMVDMMAAHGAHYRSSGIAFQNMNVFGFGQDTDYQKDIGNIWLTATSLFRKFRGGSKRRIDILQSFDGVVHSGELLVVLGPPGSGCSTFLRTISGETNGLYIDEGTYFNYKGLSAKEMHTHHRGEAIYTAETEAHFPQLTVGDTLTFAAWARRPRFLPDGIDRHLFAYHLRDVVMAIFGISHTANTIVGNEFVRGVSGGERKRVSIAEATLSGAPLQCWDNSTRGLDSANAVEFCRTLRLQADMFNSTACVSIYQASQSAYDLFDKVTVLYEGRQIFFGRADAGRQYFINLGFHCPPRATTPDFLTSMTSPQERYLRDGFENKAPRTPDDFARAWRESEEYRLLQIEIEQYKLDHPIDGADAQVFRDNRHAQQSRGQRLKSPYTLTLMQQIQLCLWRCWKRLSGDPSLTLNMLIGNTVIALIISSVFYNMQPTTSTFFQRGALLFLAALMNAFASALEVLTLYAGRPIVEKHSRYALYHPSAEAVASVLCDLPYKLLNTVVFNLTLYMMTNLNRTPGAFFFYLLISFLIIICMSMIFRILGSASRTLAQAMVPVAILILVLIIFVGFVIPINYMLGWCRWINYVDPLAYAFEALMVNEFHGRRFECNNFVPAPSIDKYINVDSVNHVCAVIGALPGEDFVSGDRYLEVLFDYHWENRWRNFGILIAFICSSTFFYMVAAEYVTSEKSKGEVLIFRRGYKPAAMKEKGSSDLEALSRVGPVATADRRVDEKPGAANVHQQTSVFHWNNVCYDVKIKKETRRILDHVDGWVKPGTLTALMGVSGAGKTTLLDCLADRVSVGVLTGEMLVDGHHRDHSFQRKTGYVQQQDLHLQSTTVREALNFSAMLRQPAHVPRAEKLAYVDEVIRILDMEEYAEAIIGVPGTGLNVEQRKRLTIGVELAAKPPLLLFVDEPTSGLDSQTSWAILDLLEKLTNAGQAILCTIHQPSAQLFERFDRLLFLQSGGRTVYFGDVGKNSHHMISYFEKHGASACPEDANPAEWMLEVIGAAPGSYTDIDWHQTWRESSEYGVVQQELQRLKDDRVEVVVDEHDKTSYREFAASFWVQLYEVTYRVFQQYYRSPGYIYSKMALCTCVALLIGFVFFQASMSIQGLQNQLFALFNIIAIFGQLVQQTLPNFVTQRTLYEARERPSKVYGWKVFMFAQIFVEMPWNTLAAVLLFVCWYYPVGLNHNAAEAGQTAERGGLMFLFIWVFLIYTGTFTDMVVAAVDTEEAAGNIANPLMMLSIIFCGVLAAPDSFPRFWIFMYRLSPFTYVISGMLSTGIANVAVTCTDSELLNFEPPNGTTCGEYMAEHISAVGGYLLNEDATSGCNFCYASETNSFLSTVGISYDTRWRDFGIMWAFVVFNILVAMFVYWLARVPKSASKKKVE